MRACREASSSDPPSPLAPGQSSLFLIGCIYIKDQSKARDLQPVSSPLGDLSVIDHLPPTCTASLLPHLGHLRTADSEFSLSNYSTLPLFFCLPPYPPSVIYSFFSNPVLPARSFSPLGHLTLAQALSSLRLNEGVQFVDCFLVLVSVF